MINTVMQTNVVQATHASGAFIRIPLKVETLRDHGDLVFEASIKRNGSVARAKR
jgi:hypothetical protein